MVRLFLLVLATLMVSDPLLAQEAGESVACPPGEDCERIYRVGGWGLVALGVLFFVIGLVPARFRRRPEEESQTALSKVVRSLLLEWWVEKEQTGWRRLQWLFIGAFLVVLGASYAL